MQKPLGLTARHQPPQGAVMGAADGEQRSGLLLDEAMEAMRGGGRGDEASIDAFLAQRF